MSNNTHDRSDHSDHDGHHHDTSGLSDKRLLGTFALNAALTVVEVVVGLLSGSVALIADGVHNLGDAVSLLIAYFARRIARKQADESFTFGYRRAETVGAVINLTSLIVMGVFLITESVERLFNPQPIQAMWVVAAASVALAVDLLTVALLWAMSKGNLNLRAAFIHNLSDAAASIVVIVGAICVKIWGWIWVDPLFGLLIAAYILLTSVSMLKRAASLLMNRAPPGFDVPMVTQRALEFEDLHELHHIHVWELDENKTAFDAHMVVKEGISLAVAQDLRAALCQLLTEEFGVEHITLQIESLDRPCDDLSC